MANRFEVSIETSVPPDAAWALVGDPTSVPRWYPLYVSCDVDGDVRIAPRADGTELVERLVERDDERRFYSYTVLSGVPVHDHLASFEVQPAGAGSRIVWRTQAEPDDPGADLEQRLSGRQMEALGRMKDFLEGTA